MSAINEELNAVGIEAIGGTPAELGKTLTDDEYSKEAIDPEVGAVVQGLDLGFNYYKMAMATLYIEHGTARYICCSADKYDLINGRKFPGPAVLTEAITATLNLSMEGERKTPVIVGKPNPYVIDLIMRQHSLTDKSRMIMFGDRMDSDITLGNRAGIASGLVLTGVTRTIEEAYNNEIEE